MSDPLQERARERSGAPSRTDARPAAGDGKGLGKDGANGNGTPPLTPRTERSDRPTRIRFRTPRDPTPVPEGTDAPDLNDPVYYLNRELTWLNFNFRVLHEAEDERTPLLERARFLSIVGSNLDEFFMKRIGGLKHQVKAGLLERTIDGRTPGEQIEQCRKVVMRLEDRQRVATAAISARLAEAGISVTQFPELDKAARKKVRKHYLKNVYPLVTPQATDPAHPFPFISNLSLNLLVALRYPDEEITSLARVKVPVGAGIPRFVKVEGEDTWVPLESVMAHNLDILFPGMEVIACELFRVTRNAIYDVDEDKADDLLEVIEEGLRERRLAPIVRLQVQEGMDPQRLGMLTAELGLQAEDVYEGPGILGLTDFMEIVDIPRSDLRDPPHAPVHHPELVTDRPIFHVIREAGSILLHHPFQSFDASVVRFLKEATEDPKVRAIKMTFYRIHPQSPILDHLVAAARNGKQVAVVIELQARFDEAANIKWANTLLANGIHVTYGVLGLKTHCKLILVVRQDHDGLRRYAHIGTGNYHSGTARLYCDHGLLTCDPAVGADLTELFNYLTTGYRPRRRYRKLLPAPKHLRQGLLERIDREIYLHSSVSPGLIQFQMNALEDPEVCRALYVASQKGVTVDLIVRDTCRIRPGIPGLSERIRVVSCVGRFLAHTRVYYFRNGGEEEYFIGSADCMGRNLDARVEVLAPVESPALRTELRNWLDTHLTDQRCAWEMGPDGSYVQRTPGEGEALGVFEELTRWAERRQFEATRLRNRPQAGPKTRGRNL